MTKTKRKRVDDFTALYPVGTIMNYRSHPRAEPRQVKVISDAFILSEHTPCVYVDGVVGCVALDALKRLPRGVCVHCGTPLTKHPRRWATTSRVVLTCDGKADAVEHVGGAS